VNSHARRRACADFPRRFARARALLVTRQDTSP